VGAGSTILAFDGARKKIYTSSMHSGELTVRSPKDAVEKQYEFVTGGNREVPRQFLVHPGGGRLFFLTSGRLVWAELSVETKKP